MQDVGASFSVDLKPCLRPAGFDSRMSTMIIEIRWRLSPVPDTQGYEGVNQPQKEGSIVCILIFFYESIV